MPVFERHAKGGQMVFKRAEPDHRRFGAPLSFAQRRLWFLDQLEGPSPTYNLAHALHLHGELDIHSLHLALIDLLQRHESLRTRFTSQDGVPSQWVLDPQQVQIDLPVQDVTALQLPTALADAARGTFDLAQQLPVRCVLYRINPQQHTLLLLVHHIACDGWSMAPLLSDLSHAYRARRRGQAPNRPALAVQYADYALWQQQLLGDEKHPDSLIARQIDYWRATLADLPDQLDLPLDHPRPNIASHRGGVVELRIDATLHGKLLALARSSHSSVYMVLQAALATLLSRLGAGDDIPLGAAVAGRTDEALDELIGFFVNTLVLRIDTSADPSFHTLLQRVRQQALAAYAHQDLPFERLVEVLNPTRSSARHPLFQILLVLHNMDAADSTFDGLQSRFEALNNQQAKFDIATFLTETADSAGNPAGLTGRIEYASELFESRTIERFAEQYVRVLSAVADNDQLAIGAIDLLSPQERQQILVEWNATEHPVPATSLPALFEQQVARRPQAEALIHAGQRISYQQLNRRANQLAHHLISLGIGSEDIVGLCLPRSPEMIVALLAVLKAGAAYLPLDPDAPASRLTQLSTQAQMRLLLVSPEITWRAEGIPAFEVDDRVLASCSSANPGLHIAQSRLAYVMYTSGTSGIPKGVCVTHLNVVNLALNQGWSSRTPAVMLLHSTYAFDASTYEIWRTFAGGGTLIVAPPEKSGIAELGALITDHGVTDLWLTSGLFDVIANERPDYLKNIREVITGGDTVSPASVSRVLQICPAITVTNGYGPTETTTFATNGRVDPGAMPGRSVPVGYPLDNVKIYVLDRDLSIVPIGVAGEVCIAGSGLSRGYYKRPGQTAEKFVADPFAQDGSRMYRTGDVGRWRHDGQLELLGRTDDQVKLRGFRIELAEIESVIAATPGVRQVKVAMYGDSPADKRIVAYVVGSSDTPMDVVRLRNALARKLPDYMIPAAFEILAHLPLTANGKIDRQALPRPSFDLRQYRAPRTTAEQQLSTLFAELLKLERVGVDDNFFELGGHSLLAIQLLTRIETALNVALPLRTLFEAPCVAQLARRLEQSDSVGTALSTMLALRTTGAHPPLFCVHPGGGVGWSYSALLSQLPHDLPLYALQSRQLTDPHHDEVSIEQMARDYLQQIKKIQPEGPYLLLGWSLGGLIAQEIAARLQTSGESVDLLVLLDSYPSQKDGQAAAPKSSLDDLFGALGAIDCGSSSNTINAPGTRLDEAMFQVIARSYEMSVPLIANHTPKPFMGRTLLFRATADNDRANDTERWHAWIANMQVYELNCGHHQMMSRYPAAAIGEVIKSML